MKRSNLLANWRKPGLLLVFLLFRFFFPGIYANTRSSRDITISLNTNWWHSKRRMPLLSCASHRTGISYKVVNPYF